VKKRKRLGPEYLVAYFDMPRIMDLKEYGKQAGANPVKFTSLIWHFLKLVNVFVAFDYPYAIVKVVGGIRESKQKRSLFEPQPGKAKKQRTYDYYPY